MRLRRARPAQSRKGVSDPAPLRRARPHACPCGQAGVSGYSKVLSDGHVSPGGGMADISIGTATTTAAATRAPSRLLFIDNIRWSMIILVLSMHAADTYSPFGNWYYVDRQQTGFGTALFFGIYQSFLQAFFMAALFFIAGYFAADAFDRKGLSRFARDRLIRLGSPTLLYMLVIGPLTQYFLSWTWGKGGFGDQWLVHLKDGEW